MNDMVPDPRPLLKKDEGNPHRFSSIDRLRELFALRREADIEVKGGVYKGRKVPRYTMMFAVNEWGDDPTFAYGRGIMSGQANVIPYYSAGKREDTWQVHWHCQSIDDASINCFGLQETFEEACDRLEKLVPVLTEWADGVLLPGLKEINKKLMYVGLEAYHDD